MKNLIIICFVCSSMLCQFSIASSENYVGIILDGYQQGCIVQSRGENYDCKASRQLYVGDKIIKKPDHRSLQIKWAPYAKGNELDKTTLLVAFDPPKDRKSIIRSVQEIIGFTKTAHTISVGATRGSPKIVPLRPCNNATLVAAQKTTFAREGGRIDNIVFKDSTGVEIFRKNFNGVFFVSLSPEEIGMKPGRIYSWNINEARDARLFTVRALPDDIAHQVTSDLREIESEQTGNTEKVVRKSIYLQFISDVYPRDFDLYWLSYQFLEQLNADKLGSEDKTLIDELKKNYTRHIMDTM